MISNGFYYIKIIGEQTCLSLKKMRLKPMFIGIEEWNGSEEQMFYLKNNSENGLYTIYSAKSSYVFSSPTGITIEGKNLEMRGVTFEQRSQWLINEKEENKYQLKSTSNAKLGLRPIKIHEENAINEEKRITMENKDEFVLRVYFEEVKEISDRLKQIQNFILQGENMFKITEFDFPEGTTEIDFSETQFLPNLKITKIPNSVTSLGRLAFCTCKLEHVECSSSFISDFVRSSKSLTSLKIIDGTTHIKDLRLKYLKKLKKLSIPLSVTSIDDDAFDEEELDCIECPLCCFSQIVSKHKRVNKIDIVEGTTSLPDLDCSNYLFKISEE